ncbi:unnamed protein product, partial [Rotaria socialis]
MTEFRNVVALLVLFCISKGTSVDRARRSESTQLGYGVSTRYWANRLMGCKDG